MHPERPASTSADTERPDSRSADLATCVLLLAVVVSAVATALHPVGLLAGLTLSLTVVLGVESR